MFQMTSSAQFEAGVRTAAGQDAAAFVRIYAPFVTGTAVSFEEKSPDESEMRRRILATLETLPWLTATSGDEVIGFAYASRHRERAAYRWSVDVSAYVAERFRGRGVATRLYRALLAILEAQGFRRAHAGITLPNPASSSFHRSMGFERVGVYRRVGWKFGAWHDVEWLARPLGADDDSAPSEPIPFAQFRERDSAIGL